MHQARRVDARDRRGQLADHRGQMLVGEAARREQIAQRSLRAVLHQLVRMAVGDCGLEHLHAMPPVDARDPVLDVASRLDAGAIDLRDSLRTLAGARLNDQQLGFSALCGQCADETEAGCQHRGQVEQARRGQRLRVDERPVAIHAGRAARRIRLAAVGVRADLFPRSRELLGIRADSLPRGREPSVVLCRGGLIGKTLGSRLRGNDELCLPDDIHTRQQCAARAAEHVRRILGPAGRTDPDVFGYCLHDAFANSTPRSAHSVSSAAMSPRAGMPTNQIRCPSTPAWIRLPNVSAGASTYAA